MAVERHKHNGLDAPQLDFDNLQNTPGILDDLENAPLSSVAEPTGGSTVDSEARTAISTIITRLEDLGLIEE